MQYRGDPSPARVLELCDEIMDCRALSNLSDRLLGPAERFLNAQSTAIIQCSWENKEPEVAFSATHAVDPYYHGLYNTHFFREDPIIHRSRPTNIYFDRCAGGQLEIFTLSDVSDYRELQTTSYYNDFFRPIRIHHVLAMCFKSPHQPQRVIGVGFHRPIDAPAFDHRDTRLARYIASTLVTKVQSLLLAEELERQSAILNGLGTLAERQGVLLIDEFGTLLFANGRARSDLGLNVSVGQKLGQPGDGFGDLVRQCRRLPRAWPGGSADAPRVEIRLNMGGRPVHMWAQTLTGAGRQARYLITTMASPADDPFGNGPLVALGLTRREADIAMLVAQGLSNPEIGEQLCISVRTVENHLRSIYAKADVQSRTQLVRRLIAPS